MEDNMTPTQRWIRNVSQLSHVKSRALEQNIQKKLDQAYPTAKYPFDIVVAYTAGVQITDYAGTNRKEPFPTTIDTFFSILQTVERMINALGLPSQGDSSR
jgi:hypothetical protein